MQKLMNSLLNSQKSRVIVFTFIFTILVLTFIALLTIMVNNSSTETRSRAATTSQASVTKDNIKVMTYNVGGVTEWSSDEKSKLVNYLETENADVIFLQELRSKDTSKRPSVYLKDMIASLSNKGLVYNYWYEDRLAIYHERNRGANDGQGFLGQAILSKFELPINQRKITRINQGITTGEAALIKDLLMEQKILLNGKTISLLNYHPQPGIGCKENANGRVLAQVEMIKTGNVIFGGDFNMTRSCVFYENLTGILTDTCKEGGKITCNPTINLPPTTTAINQIDFIFYTKNTLIESSQNAKTIETMKLSDHFPVTVVFNLKNREPVGIKNTTSSTSTSRVSSTTTTTSRTSTATTVSSSTSTIQSNYNCIGQDIPGTTLKGCIAYSSCSENKSKITIRGWICDPSKPNSVLYGARNWALGSSKNIYLGLAKMNEETNSSQVRSVCGGTTNHGFTLVTTLNMLNRSEFPSSIYIRTRPAGFINAGDVKGMVNISCN